MLHPILHARVKYPNAYKPWSPEEENLLRDVFGDGKSIEEISRQLQRQPSGIRSRVRKLGLVSQRVKPSGQDESFDHEENVILLPPAYQTDNQVNISIRLCWKPVLSSSSQFYLFPQPLTGYMIEHYHGPAIYRWKVIDGESQQLLALYIGSTKDLCPDRLSGYLCPQESKTNQRLNRAFHDYLRQGCTILLDILKTDRKTVSGLFIIRIDRDGARLFLEDLIIHHYRCEGKHLLNIRENPDDA